MFRNHLLSFSPCFFVSLHHESKSQYHMMNEQEKAIAQIQQTMNRCIQESKRTLEDTIERKAEVLSAEEMTEIERTEYTHALDELAIIYAQYPVVRSIKDYMHWPNFLWESTFLESLTMEEKRKWFHSHSLATYDDFCKDNTVFNQTFPYFSVIYKVIVNECYADYLKQRWEARELRTLEIAGIVAAEGNKTEIQSTEEAEEYKQPVVTEPADRYTFEHTLNDKQIESLVDCVNEVRMFKGGEVTFEQLKSIFDCNPITPLKSNNNRLIAFFFDQLSNRSYITGNWQSVIARNSLFLSPQKDSYLNQNDISAALSRVRDIRMEKKLEKINLYIRNLKGLSE